jgi:hypothetical protein
LAKQLEEANKKITELEASSKDGQPVKAEAGAKETDPKPKPSKAQLQTALSAAKATGIKEIIDAAQKAFDEASASKSPAPIEPNAALRAILGKIAAKENEFNQAAAKIKRLRADLREAERKGAATSEALAEARQEKEELMVLGGHKQPPTLFHAPPPPDDLPEDDHAEWESLAAKHQASLKEELRRRFPHVALDPSAESVPVLADEGRATRRKTNDGAHVKPAEKYCGEDCKGKGGNLCASLCPHSTKGEGDDDAPPHPSYGPGVCPYNTEVDTHMQETIDEENLPNGSEHKRPASDIATPTAKGATGSADPEESSKAKAQARKDKITAKAKLQLEAALAEDAQEAERANEEDKKN